MNVVVLFGSIVLVVFVITFVFGRRFGPLALSLAAGSILAGFWTEWMNIIVGGLGIDFEWLPQGVISNLILLLLPLFILLFGGPKYHKKLMRFGSALLISLLTAALLVEPMGSYMNLEGQALDVYRHLEAWWRYIASLGLVLGVADLFVLHSAKAPSKKKH